MIAVAYAGGLFSGVSGVSRSNGLMTARITLVAIVVARLLDEVAHRHVFDHAPAQRADGLITHRVLLS
jgi:hypothetical protein